MRTLLPGLAGAHVEHAWGGPIDVSADHLPVFGTVPGTRIHYGAGYTGNGVGPELARRARSSPRSSSGTDDDWSRLPLVDGRSEGCRRSRSTILGGSLVRTAMLSVEDAEDGRAPGLGARALRRIAAERLGLARRHALGGTAQSERLAL